MGPSVRLRGGGWQSPGPGDGPASYSENTEPRLPRLRNSMLTIFSSDVVAEGVSRLMKSKTLPGKFNKTDRSLKLLILLVLNYANFLQEKVPLPLNRLSLETIGGSNKFVNKFRGNWRDFKCPNNDPKKLHKILMNF